MGRGRDLAPIGRKQAQATASRLGVQSPGLVIAKTVAGGQPLYQGWEDVSVDIWGPRVGKTTSRAIPAILEAPGAVLVTSNKRDVVDATWGPRPAHGDVWPFDPQGIVGAPADWWWNPLTYVTDEVKADILADVFASASRDPRGAHRRLLRARRTAAAREPAARRVARQIAAQQQLAENINAGDIDAAVQTFAADAVDHDPAPGQGPGRDGFHAFFSELASAFPDAHIEPAHLVADDKHVCIAYTLSGTHRGAFHGVAPTGNNRIEVRGVQIGRFENAQIVERWGSTDELGILRQLEAAPAPS